jgi:hypothetical protein
MIASYFDRERKRAMVVTVRAQFSSSCAIRFRPILVSE